MNPLGEVRGRLAGMIARGICSDAEAAEALAFFDELSERELRGEITPDEALDRVIAFGHEQLRRRLS